MEDQANYGKLKRQKKEFQFENGKAIIFEYDSNEIEEEAFAQALENANSENPKNMKEFLIQFYHVLELSKRFN